MKNNTSENSAKPKPHFDISAAVVKQLGEELVTDEVTALMELVKNSYDADASWVRIAIDTKTAYENTIQHFKNNTVGYITIEDNGFGMNEDEILDGWLVISLSEKRKMKQEGKTTPQGRTPLGDKGLGRLSTQRLGDRLEMITTKESTSDINHIAFDWSSFTENTSLSNVPIHIDRITDSKATKGTKLILTNLKDVNTWEGDAADRIKGQLSQLIFPYASNRKFKVYLSFNGEQVDFDELNEDLRNQATARFKIEYNKSHLIVEGRIKLLKLLGNKADDRTYFDKLISIDSGYNFYTFLTNQTNNKKYFLSNIEYIGKKGWYFKFKIEKAIEDIGNKSTIFNSETNVNEYAEPGSFIGEIDDYDLRGSETIESVFDNLGQFKNIVKNQVGIRVFRDGFGIKPFGIDGEDWLNLSGGQTSGKSFYGLRPGNVIGFVSISAKENHQLKEKTDREGFVDSPYSKNFFTLMDYAVSGINTVLEKTKRSYNEFRKEETEKDLGIKSLKDVTTNLKKASSSAHKIESQTQELDSKISHAVAGFQELKKTLTTSKSDKKIITEIESILASSKELLNSISFVVNDAKRLDEVSNYLTSRINELENQLDEFSELAGLGLTAEALSHEMSNIIDRLVDQTNTINKEIKKAKINNSNIYIYFEYVNSIVKSLRKQLSHLAPLLKYARESKEDINVSNFANELKRFHLERFGEIIDFKVDSEKSDFKIAVSKGKITQILDNIILNSEYWLKEKLKSDKTFKPCITVEVRKPLVRIYDNGNGVDPELDNRIFQPFVTGKPRNIGRGLGLFIVQQLLESVGCEITLLQKRNAHNRKYIFQINLDPLIN